MVSGKTLALKRHVYIMLNKPRGVVCATSDAALPTVLDLVPDSLMRRGLFPAGRLDKDTDCLLYTSEGRAVISQTVTIHTGICPECGSVYVSGGTTRTTTAKAAKEDQTQAKAGEPARGTAF